MTAFERRDLGISILLLILNADLTYPQFLRGDTPYRDSIEGGYGGMARFIDSHPSPWGWNPFQYCGLPTQFLYVPGWRATSQGRPVSVEKDNLRFIKLRSHGPLDLDYTGTAEQKGFAVVSVLTWAGALAALWKNRA